MLISGASQSEKQRSEHHQNKRGDRVEMTPIADRLSNVEEVINGNGAPGIKGRLTTVETKLISMAEDIKSLEESQKWATRFILGQLAVILIGGLWLVLGR